jgi:hypothetical protein
MHPTTKGLPRVPPAPATSDFLATLPMALAGTLLPVALGLVEALFLARPALRQADPALSRALSRAVAGIAQAIVAARLAPDRARAWRLLRRAHGHASEAHRLLTEAAARGRLVCFPGGGELLARAAYLRAHLEPPA